VICTNRQYIAIVILAVIIRMAQCPYLLCRYPLVMMLCYTPVMSYRIYILTTKKE
jgi:hypothetical protein